MARGDFSTMRGFVAVTDDDLARARRDPQFKHGLLASSLDCLLTKLNKLHDAQADGSNGADPAVARQIREAVDLAVQLADRIRELAQNAPPPPSPSTANR
jgi:hypothetical protein